jgi:hypothetical protein
MRSHKQFSMRWWWGLLCTRSTRLVGFFIVLVHITHFSQKTGKRKKEKQTWVVFLISLQHRKKSRVGSVMVCVLASIVLVHWNNSPRIACPPTRKHCPVVDWFCLYNYEFWLSLCKIVRSSVLLCDHTNNNYNYAHFIIPIFNLVDSFYILKAVITKFHNSNSY